MNYNAMELMICCAARLLEDGRTAAAGTGGPGEAAGLPPGTGPYRVITDLAVLGYGERTCRMEVISLHPGVSLEQVREATGFELSVRQPLGTTTPPSELELHILREEVDPHRYI